ncbi:MAG: nucleotidyl transferase AbiEii/AbiGii toxin family protein [Bacteroidota bacterium]|nr:nucleotidyl transferase AbiEii/AbiGii toxin family protein [Bacteroidota bacterium]
MLQTQAIDPSILGLIRSLQSRDYLHGFYLAGGTALSLYLGHRKSIDVDLFSDFSFDTAQIIENLQQHYPLQIYSTSANTIKGNIENVNVDIIAHRYPLLDDPDVVEGIQMLSIPDIIAMKLNAISVSGQRSKDFIDIYFILENSKYSLTDMLEFYRMKYSQEGYMHVLKSLIYFDDVDLVDWPVILCEQNLKWPDVRSCIEKEVMKLIRTDS